MKLDDVRVGDKWQGKCHDCGCEVAVSVGQSKISGGAVYLNGDYLKCDTCFVENPNLENYRECEVYSRIVGYLRPVRQWNEAQAEMFKDRRMFRLEEVDG